jgi:hypothetical protein
MLRGFLVFLFLFLCGVAQVPIGATKQEVIDLVGWPKSTSGSQQREILNYPEFTILLEDGKVVNLRPKPVDSSNHSKSKPQVSPKPAPAVHAPSVPAPSIPPQNRSLPSTAASPAPSRPVVVSQPSEPRPAPKPQRERAIIPRPPQNTIGFVVFRALLPWMLFLGVLLVLKLIFGKKLEQKSREMRDEMLSSINEPERRALGLPPRLVTPQTPPAVWSMPLLKAIEWHRFEHVVAAYERELGSHAELTDFGPDGGVDIRVFEKEGRAPKRIIQCKAFGTQPVDVKLVRELMGVMAHEKAAQGALYTTSTFTPPALEFASDHPELDLVDGPAFLLRITRLDPQAQARLIAIATEGDYTTPTCSSCGVKMLRKTATKGRRGGSNFWGCRNYPRCQQIINIPKPA